MQWVDNQHALPQATFSNDRCREAGNESVMKALAEMLKYENAIDADHLEDDKDAINFRVRAAAKFKVREARCCPITLRECVLLTNSWSGERCRPPERRAAIKFRVCSDVRDEAKCRV